MWLSNVSSHSLYQPWSIRAVGTDVQVAHAMGTSRKWPDVLYFVSVKIWLGLSPSCCLRRVKLWFPKIVQYESLSDLNKKKKPTHCMNQSLISGMCIHCLASHNRDLLTLFQPSSADSSFLPCPCACAVMSSVRLLKDQHHEGVLSNERAQRGQNTKQMQMQSTYSI